MHRTALQSRILLPMIYASVSVDSGYEWQWRDELKRPTTLPGFMGYRVVRGYLSSQPYHPPEIAITYCEK